MLEKQAGPFAPPLQPSTSADEGQIVWANGRRWAMLMEIKMGSFTVKSLDGSGRTEALHFSEVETTGLKLDKFLAAKKRWEARVPLARKTLADDRRGHVHKSWNGPALNSLRLTDKAAPGKGYYAGVVPSVPVLMPPKIGGAAAPPNEEEEGSSGATNQSSSSSSGGAGGATQRSEYYYAHRRKIDFQIPTPAPRRLDSSDGTVV